MWGVVKTGLQAARLAYRLRGAGTVGAMIGVGGAANDLAVGAHAAEAALAMPRVAAGLGGLYYGVKAIKGRNAGKKSSEVSGMARMRRSRFAPYRARMRRRGYKVGSMYPRSYGRRFIGDPASYKQLASVKSRGGRKVRQRTRAAKLWKTVTSPYRVRFGQVQDINASTGTYWLTQQLYGAYGAVDYQRQPVYLLNLTSVTQGNNGAAGAENNNSPYKMWELVTGYTVTGQHRWFPVPGIDPIDGTSTRFTGKIVPPTESNLATPGRKGLLDWTRVKLCFWGKKKNPTQIRVRIVRFLDEEFCPEYSLNKGASSAGGGVTGAFTSKVAEFWNHELKYLLNGHMGGYSRFDRGKYMKVLKEWMININPIDAGAETTDSDPRAHMKHLDIFNRWNRVIDFTDRNSIYPQALSNIKNVNAVEPPGNFWSGYPKHEVQNLYLLIESVQPAEPDEATSPSVPRPAPAAGSDYSASFDLVLEQNFTIHDPYGATAS